MSDGKRLKSPKQRSDLLGWFPALSGCSVGVDCWGRPGNREAI